MISDILCAADPVDALQDTDQDDLISDFVEVRLGLDPRVATPRMAVSGRVVNGAGANVAGATVVALGMIQAVTNASGTFQLTALPATLGSVTLTAFAVTIMHFSIQREPGDLNGIRTQA